VAAEEPRETETISKRPIFAVHGKLPQQKMFNVGEADFLPAD
jgi:hypothetical protein